LDPAAELLQCAFIGRKPAVVVLPIIQVKPDDLSSSSAFQLKRERAAGHAKI